jgi:hypothetical protein
MADTRPHPAPWHFLVQPSLVDTRETMTESGLHVVSTQPETQRVFRGVVLEVGSALGDDKDWGTITMGGVIYYLRGIKMGDYEFVIAQYDNIVGWE